MKKVIYAVAALVITTTACTSNDNSKQEVVTKDSIVPNTQVVNNTTCYMNVLERDTLLVQLSINDSVVQGKLVYDNYEKDGSWGNFSGKISNGIIHGFYALHSEGTLSYAEHYFKLENGNLIEGIAKDIILNKSQDTSFVKSGNDVSYTGRTLKQIDCNLTNNHFSRFEF